MIEQNEPRLPSDSPLDGSGETAGERKAEVDVDGVAEEKEISCWTRESPYKIAEIRSEFWHRRLFLERLNDGRLPL